MSGVPFEVDPLARSVMRTVLLLQVGAMIVVLALSLAGLVLLALLLSCLTLLGLMALCFWLYARYQKNPLVHEKRRLEDKQAQLEQGVQAANDAVQAAMHRREELLQAEKNELASALRDLQQNHVYKGLEASELKDAVIPGVGARLKERLALHGILNAAQVSSRVAQLPGFGEAKYQALMGWRSLIVARLESTVPASLPPEELESIHGKYRALHHRNDDAQRAAQARRQALDEQRSALLPRLRQLDPVSFLAYTGRALASHSLTGVLLAVVLLLTQMISSVSATASSLLASLPSLTSPAPVPATPAPVFTRASTAFPTLTLIPSLTPDPTETPLPTGTSPSFPTLPAGLHGCLPDDTARETGLVVGVVDGDTVDVQIEGRVARVRYIGIDTPEQGADFSAEAAAYNAQLVQDQAVTLVKDLSETDRYDRLLRYVIVGDIFVNYELARLGYALAADYPPDSACAMTLQEAQRQAESAGLGIWMPLLQPTDTPPPAVEPTAQMGNCHPAYPGVCIPPAPPDLDCKHVPYTDFQVLPPDPHGFDRDGDGLGCEG